MYTRQLVPCCEYFNDTTRKTHVKYHIFQSVFHILLCTQTGKAVKAKWKNLFDTVEQGGVWMEIHIEKNQSWAFTTKCLF